MMAKLFAFGLLPESIVRWGIRRQIQDRLRHEAQQDKSAFIEQMTTQPVALKTLSANTQHYEVPELFFGLTLGRHHKYSSCLWSEVDEKPFVAMTGILSQEKLISGLDRAEEAMLKLTAERAGIKDGDKVLELGCGWGSLCLYLAQHFKNCSITAVSNSVSQKQYIDGQAKKRGLSSLKVITGDMGNLEMGETFDRIVSVEMFEHMRNYRELLKRVASWLKAGGSLFVHIFVHQHFAYSMDDESNSWMAKNFFSGGMFPSYDIFSHFQDDLVVKQSWVVDGRHYALTSEAWKAKCQRHRDQVERIFADSYSKTSEVSSKKMSPRERWAMWMFFFMACAELFKWNDGKEWFVGHYLLEHAD